MIIAWAEGRRRKTIDMLKCTRKHPWGLIPTQGTNYRQLQRNAERGGNSLPQRKTHQLVIQYQMASPDNMHIFNIKPKPWIVWCNTSALEILTVSYYIYDVKSIPVTGPSAAWLLLTSCSCTQSHLLPFWLLQHKLLSFCTLQCHQRNTSLDLYMLDHSALLGTTWLRDSPSAEPTSLMTHNSLYGITLFVKDLTYVCMSADKCTWRSENNFGRSSLSATLTQGLLFTDA